MWTRKLIAEYAFLVLCAGVFAGVGILVFKLVFPHQNPGATGMEAALVRVLEQQESSSEEEQSSATDSASQQEEQPSSGSPGSSTSEPKPDG